MQIYLVQRLISSEYNISVFHLNNPLPQSDKIRSNTYSSAGDQGNGDNLKNIFTNKQIFKDLRCNKLVQMLSARGQLGKYNIKCLTSSYALDVSPAMVPLP